MAIDKQDLVYTRTASALEQKLGTKKKYSELLGELDDARKEVEELRSILADELKNVRSEISRTATEITQKVEDLDTNVKAELELKVGRDENDQIVSMINASAEVIELKANRLIVESDNFSISEDGKIEAKSGTIGNLEIDNEKSSLGTWGGGLHGTTGQYGLHTFIHNSEITAQYVGYLFYEYSRTGIWAIVYKENSITSTALYAGRVQAGETVTTTYLQ